MRKPALQNESNDINFLVTVHSCIFDTAPVLLATESVLLSTQCDATLIVVAAGQTNQVALTRTREQIENVGAPLIGAVLNRFDSRGSSGFGYDYGYGNGYRYRYDETAPKKGIFKKRTKKLSNI